MVSESKEKENDETNCVEVKKVNHEAALKHNDGFIQYLKEQDNTTLYNKILLKKL